MIQVNGCRRTVTQTDINRFNSSRLSRTSGNGCPQAWARGGTCPLWRWCNVFYALVVTAKRSAGELFMHFFSQTVVGFWGLCPRPHQGSIAGTCWETFVPRPVICPPLEKILQAPMRQDTVKHGDIHLQISTTQIVLFSTCRATVNFSFLFWKEATCVSHVMHWGITC